MSEARKQLHRHNRSRMSLRTALRQRATLRQAYLLVEILSPPLSKRRPTAPSGGSNQASRTEPTPS
jgi:hypothetical protein